MILSFKAYSTNIAVIDINSLINNSKQFIEISTKINNAQIEYKEKFQNTEKNLYEIKEELENLKLIINQDEFNIKKEEYYKEVANFENDVNNFNKHYESEIINIKNKIFAKISELIQKYAESNQIDLILEKNQYLIAAEKINISEDIFAKLNELKLDLKFQKYEN
ncbi:OmpH family outer membrane protein [Pelagibacterales bacterium SAG-MED31]|nr:OmpH family outer membrane protein [Pelagibacterales bacterium SAG-MED31]